MVVLLKSIKLGGNGNKVKKDNITFTDHDGLNGIK